MELPFTAEQFFGVFHAYNTTLWPVQVFLLVLAGTAVVLVVRPRSWSGVGVSAILALLWGWMGLVYHLAFFTSISPPAYAFAAVFVLVSRARSPAAPSPASAPERAGAVP